MDEAKLQRQSVKVSLWLSITMLRVSTAYKVCLTIILAKSSVGLNDSMDALV